ncbi:MAG: TolC family protein [Bdellovibrionales bacterium]|jgi:outer membrane protein TolC|nr:TolC family protein [Bdellovibrionales bacterium]MBT3527395.1 TolC family protein [Bdellovibrionales bacterium]MBT7668069.1 TolC family protein [Bdellovibrionales bacterium]
MVHTSALLILIATLIGGTATSYAETPYIQQEHEFDSLDRYRTITLNSMIEQGIRKNFDQNLRNYQEQISQLNYSNLRDKFWMPSIQLQMSSVERVRRLKSGGDGGSARNNSPAGTIGVNFGDYTLYNWGKDFARYQQNRSLLLQEQSTLKSDRRKLKHQIIIHFFQLVTSKNIEKIYRERLQKASFIYRLNREKVTIGKVSKQEYYLARNEYLMAQEHYHTAKMNHDLTEEQVATLIADPPGTRYVIREELDYRIFSVPFKESNELAQKNSSTINNHHALVENAKQELVIEKKERLPLPKFTVNLGAYQHTFSRNGGDTSYLTAQGDKNLDIIATINASWALTGDGGLLNHRKTELARLSYHYATTQLRQAKHQTMSAIQALYRSIISYENQIKILKVAVESSEKSFNIIMENYLARKTSFINYKSALRDLTNYRASLAQAINTHLRNKVTLATTIGVDDFPGENFELLAKREQTK